MAQSSEQMIRALRRDNCADARLCVLDIVINTRHERVEFDLVWNFSFMSEQFDLSYFHRTLKLNDQFLREYTETLTVPADQIVWISSICG